MTKPKQIKSFEGYKIQPKNEIDSSVQFSLGGAIGSLISKLIQQWVLPAPYSNPEMLEMFRDPDRLPLRSRVAWAGEFAGKYLTHAVQLYRLSPTQELKSQIEWFVKELIELQSIDGYLGPWPKNYQLENHAPNSTLSKLGTWDTWGQYHAMLGLILWYRESKDKNALSSAQKMGDLFCLKFLKNGERIASTGWEETNQAPIHSLCLLYEETGKQEYFDLALKIKTEFEQPGAGNYIKESLAGKEFFETPKPRWESLHPIMGISELYYLTGDENYRKAFEQIWWSIVKTDRHNNGGFSSGEKAQGSPYHEGAIETCCTVAWTAMSVEMLRLTGNSIVADEIELSLFNSGLGLTSPTGRWVTYNTPMNGTKIASPNDATSFQARPAGAELNCCSVNGPRIFGMISDWALMKQNGGLALNYYGAGKFTTELPSDNKVSIHQQTDYPWENKINIIIHLDSPEKFNFSLRIPYWSEQTYIKVNGESVKDIRPGSLSLNRTWVTGDSISIEFDFRLHFWVQEEIPSKEYLSRPTSIYRGPVLLAFDPLFNAVETIPTLLVAKLSYQRVKPEVWLKPNLLLEFPTENGSKVRLCDFGSAGNAGHSYRSWLPVKFTDSIQCEFSRKNPLRSFRY